MDTLPHELIRAIVEEIDEDQSLKMCSLVHTNFREPCQRILLHSLTVGSEDESKAATAVWTLLQGSPHVAPYFTRLYCGVPGPDATSANAQALCAILQKLPNIRHCYLFGRTQSPQPWSEVPPQVTAAIAEFFYRKNLTQLYVLWMSLPKAVLTLLLNAAPTVTLLDASVEFTTSATPVISDTPLPLTVRNFLLLSSPAIAEALSGFEFRPYVASIQKLWWKPNAKFSDKLISVLAPKLKHIRVQYEDQNDKDEFDMLPILSLPPLPALESAELPLTNDDPQNIENICSISRAAPGTLREISVMCSPTDLLPSEFLEDLDSALAVCVIIPWIRWRVDLKGAKRAEGELSGVVFASAVKQGMPKLHKQGKVIFEQCSFSREGFGSWTVDRL
ncbi:hypothetical protein MVEN_02651700 [Mycena venus]|uniref:F-box domain-containing protein n=1 Tax=Mycena venus TaxID=2733690 RepID=A0A8H6WT93_9AGAR|nr:hypothetical protein MVEN_02651700 [Mycena venus]